jgi:hypothetical protein
MHNNYTFLLADVKMLGVSGRAFCEMISLVSDTKKVNSTTGKQVSAKLKAVLPRNLGQSKLKSISNTINCFDVRIHPEIHVSQVPLFKSAPITTVSVDKTLSTYKMVLSEKRCKCDKKQGNYFAELLCSQLRHDA